MITKIIHRILNIKLTLFFPFSGVKYKLILPVFLLFKTLLLSQIVDFDDNKILLSGGVQTKAVIVGISDYEYITDLNYSHRDAELFADFLQSEHGGNVSSENIQLLINQDASFGKIQSAFSWLLSETQENDKAIIYFSGHGDIETTTDDKHGFLLTYNTFSNNYWGSALPIIYLQSIITTLSNKGASVIVITDACRAGKLAGDKVNGKELTALAISQQFHNELKIMSCSPDEESLESEVWGDGRGVFTYFLEKGLKGSADQNKDNYVSVRELEHFLETEVPRSTAPHSQHPEIKGRKNALFSKVPDSYKPDQDELAQKTIPSDLIASNSKGFSKKSNQFSDEVTTFFYDEFVKAISEGNIIKPMGASAYDWYKRIITSENAYDEKTKAYVQLKLTAVIKDEIQKYLYLYIKKEFGPEDYQGVLNALSLIEKGLELVAKDDFTYSDLMAKQYFFLGLLSELLEEQSKDASYEIAIEFLTKSSDIQPFAAYPHNALGQIYHKLRKYQEALKLYEKAHNLAPTWKQPSQKIEKLTVHLEAINKITNSPPLKNIEKQPEEKIKDAETVVKETTNHKMKKNEVTKNQVEKSEDLKNLELSEKYIAVPKNDYQILLVKGLVTYGVQFINKQGKEGIVAKFYSKLGVEPNKGDELIFMDSKGTRKSYRFNEYDIFTSATETHENQIILDLEALKWFANSSITRIFYKDHGKNAMHQFSITQSRQKDFSNLAKEMINLLK